MSGGAALAADEGWELVSTRETDVGPVTVRRKTIEGLWCLRAEGTTELAPSTLFAQVWDVARVPEWSSNPLTASVVLEEGPEELVFWQSLDLPFPLADRFWVLRARAVVAEGAYTMRWEREPAAAWPAVDAGVAMEMPVSFGEWSFSPRPDGPTAVTWRGCQDLGGAVPAWLQTWGATRSLPTALVDVIHAGAR
jgi:hypothetical protein